MFVASDTSLESRGALEAHASREPSTFRELAWAQVLVGAAPRVAELPGVTVAVSEFPHAAGEPLAVAVSVVVPLAVVAVADRYFSQALRVALPR